jgi:hypothetical protein
VRLNAAIRVGERLQSLSRCMDGKATVCVCLGARIRGYIRQTLDRTQQSTLNTFRLCCDPPREQTMAKVRGVFTPSVFSAGSEECARIVRSVVCIPIAEGREEEEGGKSSRGAAITFLMHVCIRYCREACIIHSGLNMGYFFLCIDGVATCDVSYKIQSNNTGAVLIDF